MKTIGARSVCAVLFLSTIAISSGQTVLVAYAGTGEVAKYDLNGNYMGSFVNGASCVGVRVDSNNDVYVATQSTQGVRKYDSSGNYLYSLTTGIQNAFDVGFLQNGDVLVASVGNGIVQRFSSTGSYVGAFATGFSTPIGIQTLPDGNVLVSHHGGTDVRKFDPSGNFLGSFITGHPQSGQINRLSSGEFLLPHLTTVGSIQRYDTNGVLIGNFGPGLSWPWATLELPNGDILVSQSQTTTFGIRRLSSTGADLGLFSSNLAFSPEGMAILVPEPSSMLALGLAGLAAVLRRKKKS